MAMPIVAAHHEPDLLRFITCGSVDDGKSTLLGCLLWECGALLDDQRHALTSDSQRFGTRNGAVDYALLLDGLEAEREQGITIDVAYRFFGTTTRRFIAADTPGHEQYTRNMITGASTADLAVILVDAQRGVSAQTRRHAVLVGLVGVPRIVVAVTKMDMVGFAEAPFAAIAAELQDFVGRAGFASPDALPVCGIHGDNVVRRSERMPWYTGPSLLELLEQAVVSEARLALQPLRMPVQWVNRPHADFRGYAGTLAAGTVRRGQRVSVLPAGSSATVDRILTAQGEAEEAFAPQAVTLTLAEAIDVSRGQVFCDPQSPAGVADRFEARLVWMHELPLLPGRDYLLKLGTRTVTATVTPLKYRLDIHTLEQIAATRLELNDIGVADLQLDRPVAFDPYTTNRDTGGFILVDMLSQDTVAAGMLLFALRRSQNVQWQALVVDKGARSRIKGQRSAVLWMTGLSGAGKSTIANALEQRLHTLGRHTYLLDGDNVRHGLNKDLGFTDADRVENIRRVAEVAKLMVDAGLIIITAFISPFRSERRSVRALFEPGEFLEVFVDTPLAVAEARDPKGLYRKARKGELPHFTGIDSAYEVPESPECRLDTTQLDHQSAADRLLVLLAESGLLEAGSAAQRNLRLDP